MDTAIRHRLIELLTDAVQATVFLRTDGGIVADHYRAIWSSDPRSDPLSQYTMQEPSGFCGFYDEVASALGRFVGEDDEGNRVVYSNIEIIVGPWGRDGTRLETFCGMLLLAAVRSSPERVVELVESWLNGEAIRLTNVVVLDGLTMDGDELALSPYPDIKIRRIPAVLRKPEDVQALKKLLDVPAGLIDHRLLHHHIPGAVSVDGRLALFHEAGIAPVFREATDYSTPNDVLGGHPLVRVRSEYDQHILRWSFSLACNAAVNMVASWSFVPDLDVRAFSTSTHGPSSYSRRKAPLSPRTFHIHEKNGRTRTVECAGKLDGASLERARDLSVKLSKNQLGERTRLALERWIRALPTDISAHPDQYTDLRIALERLFAPDGGGEMRFRTSTRCTRFLKAGLPERKALAANVKTIYDRTSRFTHDPSTKQNAKDAQVLEQARQIVRESIFKVIDAGCTDPDLDVLDFG